MSPDEFISRWKGVTLTERASSQSHFNDLCQMLGEKAPVEADPSGIWYAFEKGAKKAGGGDGWADVWKRKHFGWEYKGPGRDLDEAFKQLQIYTPSLEYPPLLIVSDIQTIRIHTAFTGLVPVIHELTLEDLRDHAKRRLLKWAFTDPDQLRPRQTRAELTEAAAGKLGDLAQVWRSRGHDPLRVAHFSHQVLFCLFAEDIGLLPDKFFSQLLEAGIDEPDSAQGMLEELFGAMASGGRVNYKRIDWFNGGLFTARDALPLEKTDLQQLLALAGLDWSAIQPSIFGTLFERGLDPDKRAQLGAHYTDEPSIMRIVDPVVLDPLRDEWTGLRDPIAAIMDKAKAAKSTAASTRAKGQAQTLLQTFLERLRRFRVLDPACGSGNFLLLSLLGLKDLEHLVLLEAEGLGLPRGFPMVGPENVLGIELNPYAAELARVTIWIGEIQWMLGHGFSLSKNPILKPLDTIQQRDAIVNADGTEPEWPDADAIVGNPPFLGGSKKRSILGDAYFETLNKLFGGRVPGGADLVTYWFEKARAQIEAGQAKCAGLVATNSIRQPSNRGVLDRIIQTGTIFNAWSDEPWVNEGAAVRVSLVAFGVRELTRQPKLDGQVVGEINRHLQGITQFNGINSANLSLASRLIDNRIAFQGTKKYGDFDIGGSIARAWLLLPNPHGRPNSDVIKPWLNGKDVTGRATDTWIIDFGVNMPEAEAALYEAPFAYLMAQVKPYRDTVRRERTRRRWWIHEEARPGLRSATREYSRVIATPMTAKHRMFVWFDTRVLPDQQLIVIARSDNTTFGILQSRFHELWSLRLGTSLEDRPRYTPTTTFETFPFPEGLTPADTAGPTETLDTGVILPSVSHELRAVALTIAEVALRLNQLRENWLNPPEWVDRVPEVVQGYPDRIIPKPEHAAELKKRTLTNLYNARPAWLDNAHKTLDAAVATAYGWSDYAPDMPDDEILARLLALNLKRSADPDIHRDRTPPEPAVAE
ncbi:class I SAM-dependent DNA methyltransferase [Thiocapsa roseopersicina]|uniref:site-specific DNA-methyltransferase (adenine-specific) n=1 Tax=Thiocapsa roseopersicina TaxID=1058 RepID=A0A1H3ABS8_THIRO|nr:Type II restriction/modification system, DNA methylase subunit YeeA [Thiocapsa roseopersicina]